MGRDDLEEPERDLPVGRVGIRDELFQAGEVQSLGLYLVEQAREFRRQLDCLFRPRRLAGGTGKLLDLKGQQQLSPQRRNRHGQFRIQAGGEAAEQGLVAVDIVQRHHPRQQQGIPLGQAQKGFAQGPRRAPRRQQHRDGGKRQRVVAGIGEQALCQRIDKRHGRRDVEDRRLACTTQPAPAGLSGTHAALRCKSAVVSGTASGVPT